MELSKKNKREATRYLLGGCAAEEQTAMEEKYFSDPGFFEQVVAVEKELLDNYARGLLSSHERELFERHYLAHPKRRARAMTASALVSTLDRLQPEKSETEASPWLRNLFALFRGQRLAFGMTALSLLLTLGGGWLLFEMRRLNSELDGARKENEKLKQDYQAANASATELQSQLAQLKSSGQLSSSIVATLNDGAGQVTLDKEGNVAGVAAPFQQIVKQTLVAQRIETPQMLAGLIGKPGVLMGPSDEGHPIALLGPIGTVVMSDRPTFRWRALAGADGYVVRIYDSDFNEVAVSPQFFGTTRAGTAWTLTRSLERGKTYSWQVTARVGDREVISPVKPAPDAKFLVLDRAKANELAEAKSDSSGSHLTLGILYAQAGLLDDAERELQALLRANPQSALAQKLLRGVRAKRQT